MEYLVRNPDNPDDVLRTTSREFAQAVADSAGLTVETVGEDDDQPEAEAAGSVEEPTPELDGPEEDPGG